MIVNGPLRESEGGGFPPEWELRGVLGFVDGFLQAVDAPYEVYPSLNMNVPPMHTNEEVFRMRRAVRESGAHGMVFHEADDLREDGRGAVSPDRWATPVGAS